jgi:hypothetical protein
LRSLQTPGGITGPELRLDPAWDALRPDPRLERLLTRFGEKL